MSNRYTDPKERIYVNSIPEPNSGCWLWSGYINKDGYARTSSISGHILSYLAFKGPIPQGLEIDHKCRVRCCVNPDHLEAVTHAENVARGRSLQTHCKRGHPLSGANIFLDTRGGRACIECRKTYSQRRPPRGKWRHSSKISKEDASYIKASRYQKTIRELAKLFNVSNQTICRIRASDERNWR